MKGSLDAMARTVAHLLEERARIFDGAARSYGELLALACRKVDEISPLNVSMAAQQEADRLGLGDLRNLCWHCSAMNKARDGTKRLFLWEHFKPAADIQKEIERLGPKPRHEEVVAILGQTRMVWVLRREGDALGNGSRPDPSATYREKSVDLLYPWDECRPVDADAHRHKRRDSRA